MSSELWVDAYAPQSVTELAGNRELTERVVAWLRDWHKTHKPALLWGPPGVGKTTALRLAASKLGYATIETNASDSRNAKAIAELASEFSSGVRLAVKRHKCRMLVFEEVDGLAGNSDRGGMKEMLALARGSTVPVAFTSNREAKDPKMRPLYSLCGDAYCFAFKRLSDTELEARARTVLEKARTKLDPAIVKSAVGECQGDMRRLVNKLQFASRGSNTTVTSTAAAKSLPADLIREVRPPEPNPFDRVRYLFRYPTKNAPLDQMLQECSHDEFLTHSMVADNYPRQPPLRVMGKCPKHAQHKANARCECAHPKQLQALSSCAERLCEGDLMERHILTHRNYSLAEPRHMIGTIAVCSHVGNANPVTEMAGQTMGGASKLAAAKRSLNLLKERMARPGLTPEELQLIYQRIAAALGPTGENLSSAFMLMRQLSLHPDLWDNVERLAVWPGQEVRIKDSHQKALLTFARKMWNKYNINGEVITMGEGTEDLVADEGNEDEEGDAVPELPVPDLLPEPQTVSLAGLLVKRKRN